MRPLGCKAPIPYRVSYDFSSSSFISHPWHCCYLSEDSCKGLCMPQLFGQHRTLHTGGNNWQCPPAKSHIVHWCRRHTDNSNQNPHNVDRNLTGDQHLCWPHSNFLLGSHTFETRLEKTGARSFSETTRSFWKLHLVSGGFVPWGVGGEKRIKYDGMLRDKAAIWGRGGKDRHWCVSVCSEMGLFHHYHSHS